MVRFHGGAVAGALGASVLACCFIWGASAMSAANSYRRGMLHRLSSSRAPDPTVVGGVLALAGADFVDVIALSDDRQAVLFGMVPIEMSGAAGRGEPVMARWKDNGHIGSWFRMYNIETADEKGKLTGGDLNKFKDMSANELARWYLLEKADLHGAGLVAHNSNPSVVKAGKRLVLMILDRCDAYP